MEGWGPADFEAAVPLFVGGDLDAGDAKRLEEWLEAHPEDVASVDAAKASLEVLARHRLRLQERETPDLWSGIKRELQSSGLVAGEEAVLAPILGGPRWFQRKSVAAAAALLLTGSMGAALMLRAPAGDAGTEPGPSTPPQFGTPMAVLPGSPGAPVSVRAAGLSHSASDRGAAGVAAADQADPSGRVQPLRRMQPGADRLIDEAPRFLLWQVDPALAGAREILGGPRGAQLTSGGR